MQKLVCPALDFSTQEHSSVRAVEKRSWKKRAFETLALGWQSKNIPAIPAAPRCVVVATGGNLGGAILSIPLIEAMRDRFPDAHLAVITNTTLGRQVVEIARIADSIHVIDPPYLQMQTPFKWGKSVVALWRLHPEILVLNHDDAVGRWLWPLRIPVRVGHTAPRTTSPRKHWDRFYTHPIEHEPTSSWLGGYARIAEELGANWPGLPKLSISQQQRAAGANQLKSEGIDLNRRIVAFQVGVWKGQQWKQWPPNKLYEVINRTWKDLNAQPILLGAPDSKEFAESVLKDNLDVPIVSFVGKTNVVEVAALLAECEVIVANDSGLMHLGPSVGTSTIGVYGMTDPKVTWPYGPPHKVVRRADCRPCFKLPSSVMESCSHRKCLTALSTNLVVDSIDELISLTERTGHRDNFERSG
jgi:ADP-heptose:LPS heptosyltransferase